MKRAKHVCTVTGGTFLNPCDELQNTAVAHSPGSKSAGVYIRSLVHLPSHEPARRYAMVRSGSNKERGIVLNFCPFCGRGIAKAFSGESKAAAKWEAKKGSTP